MIMTAEKTEEARDARAKKAGFIFVITLFVCACIYGGLLQPDNAQAAITQQAVWTKAYDQVSGTGAGFNYAVGAGTNRILVVAITHSLSVSAATPTPPVTYGGVALTLKSGNFLNSCRTHSGLYILKDTPSVMDGTSRPLNVTFNTDTNRTNMTVWVAVFAGVDQGSSSLSYGWNFSDADGWQPAQLSLGSPTPPLYVRTGEQAIYISNILNTGSTTTPSYTINGNWSVGSNTNSGSSGSMAWKADVANRVIPVSNTSDNAATSNITTTPASFRRYSMCGISLPVAGKPTVTYTYPASRSQGAANQDITINGTNFQAGIPLAGVSFSGTSITVNSVTWVSATQLTVNITIAGNAATGARDVTVTNLDASTGTGTGVFTVNARPTISGLSPNSGAQGATNLIVTINGSNFLGGEAVSFSGTGITVNSRTWVSATQFTANITIAGNAATGARDVTVTNGSDSGTYTLTGGFTVLAGICTANAPRLDFTPEQRTIVTNAGSVTYTVTVRNVDGGGSCPNVTFNLARSDSDSTNFIVPQPALSPNQLTLAQGASGTSTLTVTAQTGRNSGTDRTTVTVSAAGHANGSSYVDTKLLVNMLDTGDGNLLRRSRDESCHGCHKTDKNSPSDPNSLKTHNSIITGSTKWRPNGWGISDGRYGEFTCTTCHTSHSTTNMFLVNMTMTAPNSPTNNFPGSAVDYRNNSGMGDDSVSRPIIPSTRICEVCHTYDATQQNGVRYHGALMSMNPGHFNGVDCIICHYHRNGFKPISFP